MIDERACFVFSTIDPVRGECCWTLPNELPYFEGHFPGNPVLPAFAIVDASLEALRRIRGQEQTLYMRQLRRAKFMQVLRPADKVTIRCVKDAPHRYTVTWWREAEQVANLVLAL